MLILSSDRENDATLGYTAVVVVPHANVVDALALAPGACKTSNDGLGINFEHS